MPIRFQEAGPLLLAGRRHHYNASTRTEIAQLWHEVGPLLDTIRGKVGDAAYGAGLGTTDDEDEFDYLAGLDVAQTKSLPSGWTTLRVPAQLYAVFPHPGHVSTLHQTIGAALEGWLPQSGYVSIADGRERPDFLERYGKGYNPATGTGDMEVWIPVKKR